MPDFTPANEHCFPACKFLRNGMCYKYARIDYMPCLEMKYQAALIMVDENLTKPIDIPQKPIGLKPGGPKSKPAPGDKTRRW